MQTCNNRMNHSHYHQTAFWATDISQTQFDFQANFTWSPFNLRDSELPLLLLHNCVLTDMIRSICMNACSLYSPVLSYEVRLTGTGSTWRSGRVEVRRSPDERWGTVCDDGWDKRDADVVCRMLDLPWVIRMCCAKMKWNQLIYSQRHSDPKILTC